MSATEAIADAVREWQPLNMDRTKQAVAIAGEFLSERLSPLQVAVQMQRIDLAALPLWEGTGGPNGPLSAFYAASDDADKCYFLGKDVERWHVHVREQKRAELAAAEDRWRGPIDHACRTVIEHAVTH